MSLPEKEIDEINALVEKAWKELKAAGKLDQYMGKRGNSVAAERIEKALLLIRVASPDIYAKLVENEVALRLGNAAGAAAYTSGSYANGLLGKPQIKISESYQDNTVIIAFVMAHESIHAEWVCRTPFHRLPLKYNLFTFLRDWMFSEYPHEETLGFEREAAFMANLGILPLPEEKYFIKEGEAEIGLF